MSEPKMPPEIGVIRDGFRVVLVMVVGNQLFTQILLAKELKVEANQRL